MLNLSHWGCEELTFRRAEKLFGRRWRLASAIARIIPTAVADLRDGEAENQRVYILAAGVKGVSKASCDNGELPGRVIDERGFVRTRDHDPSYAIFTPLSRSRQRTVAPIVEISQGENYTPTANFTKTTIVFDSPRIIWSLQFGRGMKQKSENRQENTIQ